LLLLSQRLIIWMMKVQLSHPARAVEVKGPKRVKELLRDLDLVQEAHLVIRGDDLMTEDEMLKDTDLIEIRPVISGGSGAMRHQAIRPSPLASCFSPKVVNELYKV
jgi:sulfur carrier protein